MDELEDYRKLLAESEQKAQEEFDKTVLSLSGGALGVSFAFIDKFIKGKSIVAASFLYYSWWCWSLSVFVVLLSYFCSIRALRKALKQSYSGAAYLQRPGGRWSIATEVFNITGAILFTIGLLLIGVFVRRNL